MTDLYVPKTGSLPDRLLAFLEANPDEELTRHDIAAKFGVTSLGSIDTLLQLAVTRGCLQRTRNRQGELVWSVGDILASRDRSAKADAKDDPLPVRQTLTPFPAAGPVDPIDPGKITVRKGVRLMTPEEKLAARFDSLFASFEVGDSAEFDANWEDGLRAQLKRWSRGKKVSFIFATTDAGKVGMERRK